MLGRVLLNLVTNGILDFFSIRSLLLSSSVLSIVAAFSM